MKHFTFDFAPTVSPIRNLATTSRIRIKDADDETRPGSGAGAEEPIQWFPQNLAGFQNIFHSDHDNGNGNDAKTIIMTIIQSVEYNLFVP